MKHWFSAERYRAIADLIAAVSPKFDRTLFIEQTTTDLESRELMDRMRQTALAFERAQPGTFAAKLDVLRRIAPSLGHNFVGIFPSEFVALFGLDADFETSMQALADFTEYGSAEFAIRPFLARDLRRTLAVMQRWATHPNEHIRRLASEGCRPRLPWGLRLHSLVANPDPVAPILDTLRTDDSLYVRKSVGNHLNDIAKDHPDWVIAKLRSWDLSHPHTKWIAQRGLRTLVKQGNSAALKLLGFGTDSRHVDVSSFSLSPPQARISGSVTVTTTLTATHARGSRRVVVDYQIHYIKANGSPSPKVFKWRNLDLAPGEAVTLTITRSLQNFTTRQHYPGPHRVVLLINGQASAEAQFELR